VKKLLSAVLVAALAAASGSLPLWAQQIQAAGATPAVAAAVRGIPAVGGLPVGVGLLSGAALSPSLLPNLFPAPAVDPGVAPVVQSPLTVTPLPAAVGSARTEAVLGASPAARVEPTAAQESSVNAFEALAHSGRELESAKSASPDSARTLAVVFDGAGSRVSDALTPAFRRPAASVLNILQRSEVSAAKRAAEPSSPAAKPAEKKPLTKAYKFYLAGQILYALGQEASTLIAPLYAYFQQGLGFAVAAQFVDLVAIIPGSMIGDWLVRKFDSKKVYLAGILIHAVAFLSVPAAFLLTGAFSPVHFIAFKVVSGLIYGALRGVAEKEIPSRILGQEDMERLKTAGSLFYAAFEVAELISALAVTALIAAMSLNGASLVMGLVMASSLIPNFLIRFRKGAPVGEETGSGTEKKLPLRLYLPFIFSLLFHILLYGFFAPFFALEVFKSPAFNATIIAFYTGGSLVVALLSSWLPKLTSKLTEYGWSVAGIGSALSFFWASLFLQIPVLTLGLSFLMGMGLTEMQIQWRALYQKRLEIGAQSKAFKWLMIWGVLAAIIPAAIFQAGVFMNLSMPLLLGLVGAGITLAALGVPAALRFRRAPRP